MKPLFISATGTGIGKTYAAVRIVEAFGKKGIRAGVCKPVETGVLSVPEDASILLDSCRRYNREFDTLALSDICPYTFSLPAAPFCADTKRKISIDSILERAHDLRKKCDILLIEGAGGLMVPLKKNYFMIDLAKDLSAYILLVTPSRLGCINETLLSIQTLDKNKTVYDWCVNLYEDATDFPSVTQPFYDAVFPSWWSLQNGLENFVERFL